MRAIKFRAWNKEAHTMYQLKGFFYKKPHRVKIYIDSENVDVQIWNILDIPDDVELMQYTGLEDKNDKEIYEGDILDNGDGDAHAITFNEGCFWWGSAPLNIIKRMADSELGKMKFHKVIGNIYENPELLKGEDSE